MSTVYWINSTPPTRLAIVARPRGGDWLEDDIKKLSAAGIEVLVSALTPLEVDELGLENESAYCKDCNIEWISLPIEDRSVPHVDEGFANALRHLVELKRRGKAIGIHCRAGIGRSSTIAACLLVQNNMEADEAFSCIGAARGCPVPDTDEQRAWVQSHTKQLRGP
jgi:protein-tyrosine phosphatase